jgi:hypothetical protein
MPKTFIKSKTAPLGFRTPDFFKGSRFGKGGQKQGKFNPTQFHTQHKGGA